MDGDQIFENAIVFADRVAIGWGKVDRFWLAGGIGWQNLPKFFRSFYRPRAQELFIEQSEQRQIRPDAERQREHGHGSEAGILQQLAEGEFEVVHGSLKR